MITEQVVLSPGWRTNLFTLFLFTLFTGEEKKRKTCSSVDKNVFKKVKRRLNPVEKLFSFSKCGQEVEVNHFIQTKQVNRLITNQMFEIL